MFAQPSVQSPSPLTSFNYSAPQLIERGAVAVRQKHDFFRNLWGVPEDLARMMESNNNMQPLDIIGQYKDRALQIPSSYLTAAILNGQASWLSDTAAPIFPTSEFNFTAQFKEMNQIEFTRTAVGGIPNEQTYRTTSWKDTIEKVQLNARLEMDLALDPNFGEEAWLFQLAGLASNAMLTIHKTIAYSIIHIGYTNLVGENIRNNAYDLARALAKEEESFGIAALDQTKYERMIRRVRDIILDFDTVIIPHGAINYLAELKGESTSMQSQKVCMDPVTQQLQWEFCKGKKSVRTVTYGDEVMHFVEMPQFRINMQRDASKEQVMRTSVTVAQAYQCDPDNKVGVFDASALKQENLDLYLFKQDKNQGDEVKVSFIEALESAFYWDEEREDGLSPYVHSYLNLKNNQVKQDPNLIPWNYNKSNTKRPTRDNIQRESRFDYDNPNLEYIRDREQVLDMRGYRDQYFGLPYDAEKQEYKIPKRQGDFALDVLPNRAIHKCAKAIAHIASVMSGHSMDFDMMQNEFYRLMSDLDSAPWTDEWIRALINTNISNMYDYSAGGEPVFSPAIKKNQTQNEVYGEETKPSMFPNAADIQEWRPNRFGGLDLPRKNGRFTEKFPAGFGSLPGILTIANEANDDTSEWRELGLRAKRVVDYLELVDTMISEYIGPSEVNDASLTSQWFHVNSSLSTLVDSYRHFKSPVFLAVPQQTNIGELPTLNTLRRFYDAQFVTDVDNFHANTPLVGPLISNSTKFVVILDTFSGEKTGKALFTSLDGKSGLYASVLNKLVDYTINSVYNHPNADTQTSLSAMLFITKSLIAANDDKTQLTAVNKNMDIMLNINSNKKGNTDGIALLENIRKQNYDDRHGQVNAEVVVLRDRESELRKSKPKLGKDKPSYDQQVKALNDLNRLGGKPANQEEAIVLEEAAKLLAPKNRSTTVTLDLDNPGPLTFLRSPLVSGDRLIEYMKRSAIPLIKPANPNVFYEAPLDIITDETMSHPVFASHKKGTRVHFNALPYAQLFRQGLNGSTFGAAPSNDYSSRASSRKQTYTSSRSRDIGDFVGRGFGAIPVDDNDYQQQQRRAYARPPVRQVDENDTDYERREQEFNKFLQDDEYFGPYEARYAYLNTISSPFERVLFKAIMMAPNRITIHRKLATIGQKLVNVMIFRLFIQHVMSSTIVMKAGSTTLRTAVGHGKVWVNTEQRGYSTINAGFYLGTVRANPGNIHMIPHTFPEAFIGGMGTDFMRDKSHFRLRTTDKESFISMITPITETQYTYPIHILNLPTYKSKDTTNAPHNRKWSGSDYFAHVFGYNMLYEVHGQIEDSKRHYGHSFDVSLCVHRGPVRYTEGNGRTRQVAGTGPRGAVRMNIAGAERTWSGGGVNFPDIASDLLRRQ